MKAIHGHYQPSDGSSIASSMNCSIKRSTGLQSKTHHSVQKNKAIGLRNILICSLAIKTLLLYFNEPIYWNVCIGQGIKHTGIVWSCLPSQTLWGCELNTDPFASVVAIIPQSIWGEAELCDFAWNDWWFCESCVYSHFKITLIPLHHEHNRLTAQFSDNLACVKYTANRLFCRQNELND